MSSLRALIAPAPGRNTLVEADAQRDLEANRVEITPAAPGRERGAAREWPGTARQAARSALDLRARAPQLAPTPVPRPGDAVPHANPPVVGWLKRADRATQIHEAARLYRSGELAAALRSGEPGLAEAVAAALHDGAILAPRPVDVFRDSVRGLGAELTAAGRSIGRAALPRGHTARAARRARARVR